VNYENVFNNQIILDAKEIQTRKDYLCLQDKDVELLKKLKTVIQENIDTLIKAFYDHLSNFKDLTDLWLDMKSLDRLLTAQRGYLLGVFDGKYDKTYFEERLKIGRTHHKVKLPTKWYIGAYNIYRSLIIPLISEKYKDDKKLCTESIIAFEKVINLDLQLAIDSYIYNYNHSLQEKIKELKLYQDALDNTMEAIIVTDLAGNTKYVSNGFERITGYKRDEALGKNPSILKSEFTHPAFTSAMWESVVSKGWWEGELVNKKKNGEHWDCYLNITTVKDTFGVPYAFIGTLKDTTIEKRKLASVEASEAEMEKTQKELRGAYQDTVFMLAVACEATDETTGAHVKRIQRYSEALAREVGFSGRQAEQIGISSILHDVGKIYIPVSILKKPAKLSPDEWEIMKTHTIRGEQLLVNKPYFQTARQIARCHHENFDGTGYPNGISGGAIPIAAQIAKLADMYDALITKRPYKEAWPEEAAYNEILSVSGKSLNPIVVNAFRKIYDAGVFKSIRENPL